MGYRVYNIIEVNSGIIEPPKSFVADESKGEIHIAKVKNEALLAFKKAIIENSIVGEKLIFNDYLDNGCYSNNNYEVFFFQT